MTTCTTTSNITAPISSQKQKLKLEFSVIIKRRSMSIILNYTLYHLQTINFITLFRITKINYHRVVLVTVVVNVVTVDIGRLDVLVGID
jgi:hypothetical protein